MIKSGKNIIISQPFSTKIISYVTKPVVKTMANFKNYVD